MNELFRYDKYIDQRIFDKFIDALMICEIIILENKDASYIKAQKHNNAFYSCFNVKNRNHVDLSLLFGSHEIERLKSAMVLVSSTGESKRLTDFVYYSHQGAKIFDVDIIGLDQNNEYLLIFHDISSRIDLEQALLVAIQQIETAITIGNVIREQLNLDETLQRALKAAKDMVGGRYATIFRVNEEKNRLELVAEIDLPAKLLDIAQVRPLGPDVPSFSGKSAYYNQTVVITDSLSQLEDEKTKQVFTELNITDVLSCPIPFEKRSLGVVQITRVDSWHFTPQEIQLLESFATWLGLVIMDASHKEDAIKLRKEAEFFIDLMTHDLTNLNAISFACLEDLEARITDILDSKDDGFFFLKGLKKSLMRTQELVNKVRTLSNAREIQSKDFKQIDLIHSLNKSINHIEKVNINKLWNIELLSVKNGPYFIQATELLDQLFINILLTVFDVISNPKQHLKIIIEPKSSIYKIIFESSYKFPLEISNRLVRGSIIEEIGGSRSDVSSIGQLIVKTLIKKYHGKIIVEHDWEPEIQSRVIIEFPKII